MDSIGVLSIKHFSAWELQAVLVAFTGAALSGTLFLQVVFEEEPCALCLSQRMALTACGLLALSSLFTKAPSRYWSYGILLFAFAGVALVLRQLYIQWVPGASLSCGPGFTFLLENEYPASFLVQALLTGTAECSEKSWIPFASLSAFIVVIVLALFNPNKVESVEPNTATD